MFCGIILVSTSFFYIFRKLDVLQNTADEISGITGNKVSVILSNQTLIFSECKLTVPVCKCMIRYYSVSFGF